MSVIIQRNIQFLDSSETRWLETSQIIPIKLLSGIFFAQLTQSRGQRLFKYDDELMKCKTFEEKLVKRHNLAPSVLSVQVLSFI